MGAKLLGKVLFNESNRYEYGKSLGHKSTNRLGKSGTAATTTCASSAVETSYL